MDFEWDDAKAASNFGKHGVEFDFAVRVFLDEARADFDTSRATDAETRRKVVGTVEGELYTVVYTVRQNVVRIISARRANVSEARIHASIRARSE